MPSHPVFSNALKNYDPEWGADSRKTQLDSAVAIRIYMATPVLSENPVLRQIFMAIASTTP